MEYKHSKHLVPFARNLRKNMTKEDRHLWYDFLRTYPVKVLRQKPIGNYVVDFYCAKAKLVIELDGSQHYDDIGLKNDKIRTSFLETYGIKVLRVTSLEIQRNFRGVCEYIDILIQQSLRQPKG